MKTPTPCAGSRPACTAAQQLTGEQGRYAGTDTDRLAQGLDLAQRGGVTLAEDLDDLRAEVTSGTAHYTVDLAQLGCPCLDVQQRNAPCMHLLAAEIHTGALGLFTASDAAYPSGHHPASDATPACRRSQERPRPGRPVRVARVPGERTVARPQPRRGAPPAGPRAKRRPQ